MNLKPIALMAFAGLMSATAFAQETPTLTVERMPMMPRGLSSFGAATPGDGWVYVFGGHYGGAHEHSVDNTTGAFMRFNMADRSTWESLPDGPPVQGTALVAHDGMLYRVGGMFAKNEAHEPSDMESVATVSRFDPLEGMWRPVTPLPSGRSSHDAFVIGDMLYVVGGWTLAGAGNDSSWQTTALRADLTQEPIVWEEIAEPPFERRALSIAEHRGQLVVLGGLTPDRQFPNTCMVYDPATDSWSEGPELPVRGFGIAAHTMEGRLYASGNDGRLLTINDDQTAFESVAEFAFGRFFHRMVPVDGEFVSVGGVAGAHARLVEFCRPNSGSQPIYHLSRPMVGMPQLDRVLAEFRGSLYVGAAEAGNGQVFRVSLADMSVKSITPLPVPISDYAAGRTTRQAFVVGGQNQDGTPSDRIYEYAVRADDWFELEGCLPQGRINPNVVVTGDDLWVFGGTDQNGDCVTEVVKLSPTAEDVDVESAVTTLPRARVGFATAILAGKVHLIGGVDQVGQAVRAVDVFDPTSGEWSQGAALPKGITECSVVESDGQLLLFGGRCEGDNGTWTASRAVYRLDANDGWSAAVEQLPFDTTAAFFTAIGETIVSLQSTSGASARLDAHVMRAPSPMKGTDGPTRYSR
ncbi:MAG: hypothetical protein AAF196_15630 [Planctomycetota bacterium]